MKEITRSNIFKLSIISSILLFLSIFYGQKLWSMLWLIFGFIEIVIIIFFTVVLISSLSFWIKKKTSYDKKYVPFCICVISLLIIILLPLNWIRNRTNFFINEEKYEQAAEYIKSKQIKNTQLVVLPKQYQYLSDGKVLVINSQNKRAVLFYTFRGIPDGFGGFLKIDKQQNIDSLYNNQNYKIRNIGNNWYHVSGE